MSLLTRLRGAFRTLPDFLIIGGQRCGTTSLYDYLARHPGIRPASRKEVHFFDHRYDRGELWYRACFPRRRSPNAGWVTGEATPNYIFNADVPARVAQLLPDVKLVATLREPVARAYSHYHLEVRKGYETRPFEQAIDEEPRLLAEEREGEAGIDGTHHRHHSYLARGRYAEQLERWFEHFPREQLLVLRSEDVFADAGRTLARITRHIGAGEPEGATPPAYQRRNKGDYDDMSSEMRARLIEHYAPHNERLAELIGDDLRWDVD